MAEFLGALVLLLVASPFVELFAAARVIEACLLTLVLLSAVPAVGGHRGTLLAGGLLVAPAVVGTWLDRLHPGLVPLGVTQGLAGVFVVFVIAHLLHFIMRAPHVDNEVLCAGIATYLLLGLLWSFAYTLVARLDPQAFAFAGPGDTQRPLGGFEALYFSFVTLTTVGYGDIMPVASVARMLAMLEATCGLFYITVLLARLVALYTAPVPDVSAPLSSKEQPS